MTASLGLQIARLALSAFSKWNKYRRRRELLLKCKCGHERINHLYVPGYRQHIGKCYECSCQKFDEKC